MSMTVRGRLLAAIFSVGLGGALVGPASAETLADAIAMAYENNPTLQAQRATQRALDENYVQARTGWRPTLSLSGQAAWQESRTPQDAAGFDFLGRPNPTIVNGRSASAGVTFSQPLWTGGRVAAQVSAAQAEILAGRENLRRIEAQILGQVIQAYADVRRDEAALAIRQENVNVLSRQLQESQARFDVGEVTRTDVAQSQARLAQAQALFQQTQAQLAITRATYAQVVGRNPGQLEPEPSLAYLLPSDPDQAFSIAEQNNPQLRAQQFTEQASRARVAGARAERMPNVSAQSTLRFNSAPDEPYERDLYDRVFTAGVNVTVPLFSGGLVSSRIRQAVERNNTDRLTTEIVRRGVLQNITSAWSQLIAARANIASSDEQVRAARIAAEGTRQEQQVGLRTTIDVLNAEQELRQAELNQVTARRDEYVAAATVLSGMGRLEAKNLTPTVPRYDPVKNFRKLRLTWGWVPWEEPIGIVDRVLTPWPAPTPDSKPVEAPIPPGLQPPPAVTRATPPR
ncbi:TolC family outer membrane protein [Phenylobacterium sp.]|uniref:TolC family outer membrane protein n=1 Tax=Phenylobacterium sp. TaxID=1871053 RepID=UPI002810C5B2|nr:TolC family outer membrane protein [Phenylobacterium sp.]